MLCFELAHRVGQAAQRCELVQVLDNNSAPELYPQS